MGVPNDIFMLRGALVGHECLDSNEFEYTPFLKKLEVLIPRIQKVLDSDTGRNLLLVPCKVRN